MKITRTILTLMTGTAIALGTVAYGGIAMADDVPSADELTLQAFENAHPAHAAKTKQATQPTAITAPQILAPEILASENAAPAMPITSISTHPTRGVEVDLGVLGGPAPTGILQHSGPVTGPILAPMPVADVAKDDLPDTIIISSQTNPDEPEQTEKPAISETEALNAASLTTPLTAPVLQPAAQPSQKPAIEKAIITAVSEPATKPETIVSVRPTIKPASKPVAVAAQAKAQTKSVVPAVTPVEIPAAVALAAQPKTPLTAPELLAADAPQANDYTAIINPPPATAPTKSATKSPAEKMAAVDERPLPLEAEFVISEIQNLPGNAPPVPKADELTSFPIKVSDKTQSPGIDRVLMQTGRIGSSTISTQKIASTNTDIPPVPASPTTPVAQATITATPPKDIAPVKKIVDLKQSEKIVEPEKPAPIILGKAESDQSVTQIPVPGKKPIQVSHVDKTQREKTAHNDVAAEMNAITPAAGETQPIKPQTIAVETTPTEITAKITAQATNDIAQNNIATESTAPVPSRRPAIQNASVEFVERARRTYRAGEVYRAATHNEGMPIRTAQAAPQRQTSYKTGTPIPAPTLSVADLGNDPLARQVVDMSADDIAAALNNIETAAGTRAMSKSTINSAHANTHPYGEMPIVQRGFVFRPKVEEIKQTDIDGTINVAENTVTDDVNTEIPQKLAVPPPPPSQPVIKPKKNTTIDQAAIDSVALNAISPAAKGDVAKSITTAENGKFSLVYDKGVGTVSDEILAQTMGQAVEFLKNTPETRVQIVAFASPANDSQSTARRTSLSRALNVRAWLMDKGIEASRMDVRALGVNPDDQNLDRVDLIMVEPGAQ